MITVTVIGLIACVFAMLAAHQLLRPLQRIMDAVEAMSAGNTHVEAPVTSSDEFGQLAHALNQMTGKMRTNTARLHEQILQDERLLVSALPPLSHLQAAGRRADWR